MEIHSVDLDAKGVLHVSGVCPTCHDPSYEFTFNPIAPNKSTSECCGRERTLYKNFLQDILTRYINSDRFLKRV